MNLCFGDVRGEGVTAVCELTTEKSLVSAEGEAACGEAAAPHASTGAVAPSRVGSPLGLVFFFPTHPARTDSR